MAKKSRNTGATPIETVRHKDKRTNIPTEELRDFVAHEEQPPFTVRYPRNPDLDPQLGWKGKDEQDTHPLEVPASSTSRKRCIRRRSSRTSLPRPA